MSKLKSKSDVIEWYWPDYLHYCMLDEEYIRKNSSERDWKRPTVDGFWTWYVTQGPMGVKHRNLFYTKEDVVYV